MGTDFLRAAKLLLAQLLKLDINEQLIREVDYLMAENKVLKNLIMNKHYFHGGVILTSSAFV